MPAANHAPLAAAIAGALHGGPVKSADVDPLAQVPPKIMQNKKTYTRPTILLKKLKSAIVTEFRRAGRGNAVFESIPLYLHENDHHWFEDYMAARDDPNVQDFDARWAAFEAEFVTYFYNADLEDDLKQERKNYKQGPNTTCADHLLDAAKMAIKFGLVGKKRDKFLYRSLADEVRHAVRNRFFIGRHDLDHDFTPSWADIQMTLQYEATCVAYGVSKPTPAPPRGGDNKAPADQHKAIVNAVLRALKEAGASTPVRLPGASPHGALGTAALAGIVTWADVRGTNNPLPKISAEQFERLKPTGVCSRCRTTVNGVNHLARACPFGDDIQAHQERVASLNK
jgi:hypothetical protein